MLTSWQCTPSTCCTPLPPVLKARGPRRTSTLPRWPFTLHGYHQHALRPRRHSSTQCLKAFLADQRASPIVDVLRPQAAGTPGAQRLKAIFADQLGLLNDDALQTQAAGTQGTECLKAFSMSMGCKPKQPALKACNA